MKFKTIAAATLAVATMLGMGACGDNARILAHFRIPALT